jgi:hypothetical protein
MQIKFVVFKRDIQSINQTKEEHCYMVCMSILNRLIIMYVCNYYVSQSKHVCYILTKLFHAVVHYYVQLRGKKNLCRNNFCFICRNIKCEVMNKREGPI